METLTATAENIILQGTDVKSASAYYNSNAATESERYGVSLELNDSGKQAFAEATARLAGNGCISIWMDDTMISYPNVNTAITDGQASISGSFTLEEAKQMVDSITAGAES